MKRLLCALFALAYFRPARRARMRKELSKRARVVLLRVDDRVGEALLMTPLLSALVGRFETTVVAHPKCVRVLEGHAAVKQVVAFDVRQRWLGPWSPGVRALRPLCEGAIVINCANWGELSATSALVARWSAPRSPIIGPVVTRHLCDVPIPPKPGTTRETVQRLHLLSPLGIEGMEPRLSFREPRGLEKIATLLEQTAARPSAVVNPGGRLGYRRVPPEVFSQVCRGLLERGRTPLVTWGPGEEALAKAVVAAAPGAVLACPTNLDELAALMKAAGLTICNNTGPMHLSVAVQVRTVGLFLHMSLERWGHAFAPHQMVDLSPWASSPELMADRVMASIDGS